MSGTDFSEIFTTKLQANDFCDRLSETADLIFKDDFNLEGVLAEKLGVLKRDRLMVLIRDSVDVNNNSVLQGYLNSLVTEIKSMPVVSLTFAFVPSEKNLRDMSVWLVQNTGRQLLIDYEVDEKLIGGVKVNYNGKFSDQSALAAFQEILKKILT